MKWPTRYKLTVYDWADQVANGFPIPEKRPISLSGGIYWRTAGNVAQSATFSHPEAGPLVLYPLFAAGDTVYRVSTNGAGSISLSGTREDGTPFWCGPAYPAHPTCYFYRGEPGYANFERLNAEAELTADSTSAGYDSPVTFNLKAMPDSVEGQEMWLTIDKTSWIPDADSLGGDWADAAISPVCSWTGPPSNKTCTRRIKSSGTLKVVGGVNGKYFEKTWHISRTDAYPIVTASKYFVDAGQIDTFRVRMSDGSTFKMSRWYWVADSGVAQTTIGCALYANPCNNTAVKESGRMRARVVHNSVYKYSQVHVTVGPPPRLAVSPAEVSVLLGERITFATSAGGAPYSITGWSFRGNPISSCGNAKQCEFMPPHTGELRVDGFVDKETDSATAVITVRLNGDDSGANGVTADSGAVSVLTLEEEGGVSITPPAGKYVFPKDTSVTISVAALPGYTEDVTILDDTISSNNRTLNMDRSHAVVAAARPDFLANPDVADVAARFNALLNVDANKRASYAALIKSYFKLQYATSVAYADWVFDAGRVMGANPFQEDSAAMRALDEALDATRFMIIASGDSIIVGYEAPGLVALRAAPSSISNDVFEGGKRIRIMFVNGVHNDYPAAETSNDALISIVRQIHVPHGSSSPDTLVELFHNPDYKTQRAMWSVDLMCGQVFSRYEGLFGRLVAFKRYADCHQRQLVLTLAQVDLIEAWQSRQAALNNLPAPPVYGVKQFARRLEALNGENTSAVVVAHSQGALVTRDAVDKLRTWQGTPANADSTCVAVLALASPIPRSEYEALLGTSHVRALTARRDILDFLGVVDAEITHFDSQVSLQGDTAISHVQGTGAEFGVSLNYALRAHEVVPNYFGDALGAPLVKSRLQELITVCGDTPLVQ